MKLSLLLAAILAAVLCVVFNYQLEQRDAELAVLRQALRAADESRVPRLSLDSTRTDLVDARAKISTLETELAATRARVTELDNVVTALQNRPPVADPNHPRRMVKPGLVKGGFRTLEENLVYLPDSQFRIGDDLWVASAKGGMMMSDKDQQIFGGNLVLQTSHGTIQGDDAMLEVSGEQATLTAKQVIVTLTQPPADSAPATTSAATSSTSATPAKTSRTR